MSVTEKKLNSIIVMEDGVEMKTSIGYNDYDFNKKETTLWYNTFISLLEYYNINCLNLFYINLDDFINILKDAENKMISYLKDASFESIEASTVFKTNIKKFIRDESSIQYLCKISKLHEYDFTWGMTQNKHCIENRLYYVNMDRLTYDNMFVCNLIKKDFSHISDMYFYGACINPSNYIEIALNNQQFSSSLHFHAKQKNCYEVFQDAFIKLDDIYFTIKKHSDVGEKSNAFFKEQNILVIAVNGYNFNCVNNSIKLQSRFITHSKRATYNFTPRVDTESIQLFYTVGDTWKEFDKSEFNKIINVGDLKELKISKKPCLTLNLHHLEDSIFPIKMTFYEALKM